ncbi:glycosyltransferase [Arthrobacter crystallopoietes BAB-32]|uniref:Glycosyltransferase n=1 Tax=Arthrobacter crystallopoietes BAB-32 TaxID=1246476 RepID=N1UZ35_9MICC|nr:glycosyltransferase [Arthrobacter crystallopoietes]EMY35666.1 glycosyltransferase [Arthrobacter crystallopoietes BAB-32]
MLHLYDAADVGATLVKYGRRAGLPWRQFDRTPPSDAATAGGPAERARRLLATITWQAGRAARILRSDLLHVHSGSRIGIVRSRPHRPFLLHLHGTDIRTQFYDPARRPALQWGADNAAAVLYSTPDLAEHAAAARPDAIYLPNPLDIEELPRWAPAHRPRVVFSSRWEDSKGGRAQLAVARSLLAAVGPDVEVQGLDWGAAAPEAADLGVRLLPKMPKPAYLRWLASAQCVVGQSAGILAMSELQAVGIGVPVVMQLGAGYYPGPSPVLAGSNPAELTDQVRTVLEDPQLASQRLDGPGWARENHGPQRIVRQLAELYAGLCRRPSSG